MVFKPGQSGNPGGRRKDVGEVKELARAHTVEAITTLVEMMRGASSERVRVAAADSLLDRAHGRPAQAVTGEDGGPIKAILQVVTGIDRAPGSD